MENIAAFVTESSPLGLGNIHVASVESPFARNAPAQKFFFKITSILSAKSVFVMLASSGDQTLR